MQVQRKKKLEKSTELQHHLTGRTAGAADEFQISMYSSIFMIS